MFSVFVALSLTDAHVAKYRYVSFFVAHLSKACHVSRRQLMKTAAMVLVSAAGGFIAGLFIANYFFQQSGPPGAFVGLVAVPLTTAFGVVIGFFIARSLWW